MVARSVTERLDNNVLEFVSGASPDTFHYVLEMFSRSKRKHAWKNQLFGWGKDFIKTFTRRAPKKNARSLMTLIPEIQIDFIASPSFAFVGSDDELLSTQEPIERIQMCGDG